MIEPGDDLASIIYNNIIDNNIKIDDGDVIAVAQKVISKSENRYRSLDEIVPSEDAKELANQIDKDPQFVQAVLDESAKVLRYRHNVLIVEHKLGFVHANAGIDRSNVKKNSALLLPEDPNKSADKFRKKFESLANLPIAVIISDTFGRAWRKGQVNFAIGSSGISPIDSYIGKLDSFDNELNATEIAVIDELASAAELVMKKTIDIPIAIIRGVDYKSSKLNANELIREDNEDFFL